MVVTRWQRSFFEFLATEGGLTSLLVSLVLYIFVLYPVVDHLDLSARVLSFSFSVVLIASSIAAAENRRMRYLAAGLGMAAIASHWLHDATPMWATRVIADVTVVFFLLFTILVLLARVLEGGRVTFHRIGGAIAAYLLLGLLWTEIYGFIDFLIPGSFLVQGVPLDDNRTFSSTLLYFSFVTLTTLGYGDVVPVSIVARLISVLEAITGVFFLGTLIARLVSLHAMNPDRAVDEESSK
jgi:hypothetical protein